MATCVSCGAALPDGARFCPACGTPVAPAPAVEERKLASVLFADLAGSTASADDEDPERTRARLERFYAAMAAEIENAGGTVEKFAGDAVMAAFGAPAALEDHAERALHAGLAMHRRLHALFGDELALRIGVNTGEVVVGRAREGSSFVSGDAVNVAARLEQGAQPGEILAGDRTAAAARGAFEFGEPRSIGAKGKDEGLSAIPVRRALSLMRPRGVSGLRRAFVGRDAELALLLATYARTVTNDEPHMVTIMADAGVGKTRLVRELWERLGVESPEPVRRTGRCLAYGRGITYWPLGEILKEHLGILDSDAPETVRRRLGDREILGLALGLDVAAELHPLAARDRLHDAWVELIEGMVAERPVVLLVEDVHWAEEPLLDVLERLARDVHGPLLVIATARPELLDERPTWGGGRRNTSLLGLEPLSAGDAGLLVEELVAAALPEELQALVVARAEGNPFFVEELLATLIDRGVLERRNGSWAVRELPAEFHVPDSVHAVLAARMDLLPADQKAALQTAAVMGRSFWSGALADLLAGDVDLGLLEERDFIRGRSGSSMEGQREYVFKHALTREVAYAGVPKARRARLHAAFAAWLERLGKDEELAPLLAHHYAEAVLPEDVDLAWGNEPDEAERLQANAAVWLRRAGELAIGRYELVDGIVLLERAVEIERDVDAQVALWREIGRAHALRFDGEPFWSAMQRSLELSSDRRQRAETLAELGYQTSFRAGMWPRAPDHDLVAGWIEQAIELAEPGTPALAKAYIARAFWTEVPAPEDARAAGAIAEQVGDPELRSTAFAARAVAAFDAGRFEEALEWAQRPFDLVDELRDPEKIAEVYETPVPMCAILGRIREARRIAALFEAATRRLSPHHRLHGIASMTELEEVAGAWDAVCALIPRIERIVEENLATPCIRNQRTLLVGALASLSLGDEEEARRLETKAESLAMEGYVLPLYAPRIRLALKRGDLARVADLVEERTGVRRRRHIFWFKVSGDTADLDALVSLGRHDEATELADELIRRAPYTRAFGLRALGQIRGDPDLLREAAEAFRSMHVDSYADETKALLAS